MLNVVASLMIHKLFQKHRNQGYEKREWKKSVFRVVEGGRHVWLSVGLSVYHLLSVPCCLGVFFNYEIFHAYSSTRCCASGTERRLDQLSKKKGMGIRLGDAESDCLTNERLADDVLLFSTSLEQLQNMLCDSKRSIEKLG